MPHVEEGHNGGLNSGDVMKIQKRKESSSAGERIFTTTAPQPKDLTS